jgi:phage baseplate assembly protein W
MTTTIYGKAPSLAVSKDIISIDTKVYGFGYPLEVSPKKGYFQKQSGVTLVRNNLRQLLLTTKGERVMLPDYGTDLYLYLFEPLDKFTVQNIRDDILNAIIKYAPGVTVTRLQVFPSNKVTLEGLQGLYIILDVKVEELDNQIIDIKVEVG